VHEVKLVDGSAFHAMVLEDKGGLAPVYAQALQDVMYFLEKRKTHSTELYAVFHAAVTVPCELIRQLG
jgi:hypothetical protein